MFEEIFLIEWATKTLAKRTLNSWVFDVHPRPFSLPLSKRLAMPMCHAILNDTREFQLKWDVRIIDQTMKCFLVRNFSTGVVSVEQIKVSFHSTLPTSLPSRTPFHDRAPLGVAKKVDKRLAVSYYSIYRCPAQSFFFVKIWQEFYATISMYFPHNQNLLCKAFVGKSKVLCWYSAKLVGQLRDSF